MGRRKVWRRLARDLFLCQDACNVYLLRCGETGIALDFGSGSWLDHLGEIGVCRVEHVVLTHLHRDQCYGLYCGRRGAFELHIPQGEAPWCRSEELGDFWTQYQSAGCPPSYAAPRLPLPAARADMAAHTETMLGGVRFCALETPGHTPGALSYLVEWRGLHLAFCGDAAHEGGTLHQPYHLEWDHWTASGALAAWYGLERLSYCYFDFLLPAHGPPVLRGARACVRRTRKRLMDLVRAKGSVCAGEKNRWADLEALSCGARRVLPHLYHFGTNGFLLLGAGGAGLVIDPTRPDMEALSALVEHLGLKSISAATATHYHLDHSDALEYLRRRYGARVWLHPWVATPLRERDRFDLPWLPPSSIAPDRLLPAEGAFHWNEYRFEIRPFPGQTWWHCAFDTLIDGVHVLFGGDNFQPPSRWQGTGGFCAFNGSRFSGFRRSAQSVLEVAPELICNGHGCIYPFAPGHYRRILRWAAQAEKAVAALCPSRAWESHYDPRRFCWEPFVVRARPGHKVELCLLHHNHREQAVLLSAAALGPRAWRFAPERRRIRVPAGARRRLKFSLCIPPDAGGGRHLIAAEVFVDETPCGEACVGLIDLEPPPAGHPGERAAGRQPRGG